MYIWRRDTLDEGLRVVTIEVPHLHTAMVSVYVHTGSRHEHAETNGVSHFLEHILFRGCDGYPDSRRLNAAVEGVGGSLNGATCRDHGYYYTLVHPEGVPQVLEVTGRMLAAPLVKEVELERQVILEEILDEVDEDGRLIDVDTLSKRIVFGHHPLSLPIAGTDETVRAIDEAALRRHHAEFYCARNVVITVAGPVKHEAVVATAARAFAGLAPGRPVEDVPPPPFPAGPHLHYVSHRESQTELRLTFPALPESHPDYPAQVVLTRILDDGLTSRLQQEIVESRGLAYALSAGLDLFSDRAVFEIDATTAHKKVPELIGALQTTLARLVREPPDAEELALAKVRHRYGVDFMQDSVGDLVGWFGVGELHGTSLPLEARIAAVSAVTAEDVRRVASELLRPEQMLAVVVGRADEAATRRIVEAAW
jgi:predicted Zn-dependent peptidase